MDNGSNCSRTSRESISDESDVDSSEFNMTENNEFLAPDQVEILKNISTQYIPVRLRRSLNINGWDEISRGTGKMGLLGSHLGLKEENDEILEVELSENKCFNVLLDHCEARCINIGDIYEIMGRIGWFKAQEKISKFYDEIVSFHRMHNHNRRDAARESTLCRPVLKKPRVFIFFSPSNKAYCYEKIRPLGLWLKDNGIKTYVDIWRQENTKLEPKDCIKQVIRNLLTSDYIIVIPSSYLNKDLKPYRKNPTCVDRNEDGPHTIAIFKEILENFNTLRFKFVIVLPHENSKKIACIPRILPHRNRKKCLPREFNSVTKSYNMSHDADKTALIGHLVSSRIQ